MGDVFKATERFGGWIDLCYYLKLEGFEVDKAKTSLLWERCDFDQKPIEDVYEDGLKRYGFVRILDVWERASKRFVLYSNGFFGVFESTDREFNYLDTGRWLYRGMYLVWDAEMTPQERDDIERNYPLIFGYNGLNVDEPISLSREEFFGYLDRLRERFTREQIESKLSEAEREQGEAEAESKLAKFEAAIRQLDEGSLLCLKVGDFTLHRHKVIYERAELNIREEIGFADASYSMTDAFNAQLLADIEGGTRENAVGEFFSGFLDRAIGHEQSGYIRDEFKTPLRLLCGRVTATLDKRLTEVNATLFLLDGVVVRREDLREILLEFLRLENAGQYEEFISGLRETPYAAQRLLHKGVPLTDGQRFSYTIEVRKEKGRYYVFFDEQHKYLVEGGYGNVESFLRKHGILSREYHRDLWRIFQGLNNLFKDRDYALRFVEKAKQEYIEAEKRAFTLFQQTLTKFGGRVQQAEFNGKRGVLVEGQKGRYFVDLEGLSVCEFPSGRYICIIDRERGRSLHAYDRMVARIYGLLNDTRIANQVQTLAR